MKNNFRFSYGPLWLNSNLDNIISNTALKRKLIDNNLVIYFNNENNNSYTGQSSISVCRPFTDIYGNLYGFVEVEQDYAMLENICETYGLNKVYILSDKDIIYPYKKLIIKICLLVR